MGSRPTGGYNQVMNVATQDKTQGSSAREPSETQPSVIVWSEVTTLTAGLLDTLTKRGVEARQVSSAAEAIAELALTGAKALIVTGDHPTEPLFRLHAAVKRFFPAVQCLVWRHDDRSQAFSLSPLETLLSGGANPPAAQAPSVQEVEPENSAPRLSRDELDMLLGPLEV